MKKIIIIVLICMISYVYADTSNDCDTVVSAEFSEYTSILPVSDFAIAKSHILAYCCKEKLSSFADSGYREKYCKDLPSVYPESPFWYDHLVDVGFRRLDVVGAYDKNSVDVESSQWYQFIAQEDDPTKTTTPLSIYTEYQRKWPYKNLVFLTQEYMDIKESDAGGKLLKLRKYDTELSSGTKMITLSDKYINRCTAARLIYEGLLSPDDRQRAINVDSNGYYDKCIILAKNRVQEEYLYAKILMIQRSTHTLTTAFRSYVDEFSQNRLMSLKDKLNNIFQLFTIIKSQAPLCDKCSR